MYVNNHFYKCNTFDDMVKYDKNLFPVLKFPSDFLIFHWRRFVVQEFPFKFTPVGLLIQTVCFHSHCILYGCRCRYLHSRRSSELLSIQFSWPMTARQRANADQWRRSVMNTDEWRALTELWWMTVKRQQIVTKIATSMTCMRVTRYRNL